MNPILKDNLITFLRVLSYLITAVISYLTGGAAAA